MRPSFPILVLAIVLAGCASAPAAKESPASLTPPPPSSSSAAAPAAAPSPASNAGAANASAPATNASTPAAVAPHTVVVKGTSSMGAIVGAPCADGTFGCGDGASVTFAKLSTSEGAPTKATLVAKWTATTPLAQTLYIDMYPKQGNAFASAKGVSPLTIVVPVAALAKPGDYLAAAWPDTPGVEVQQDVSYELTLQYG